MYNDNTVHEIDIVAYNSDGEGIGRLDGYAVFVPYAAVGERLRINLVKVGKSHGYGKILDIITPSPCRHDVKCKTFTRCGGCSVMHLTSEAQADFKRQKVVDALERIGGFNGINVSKTVCAEDNNHYRNKAQLPVKMVNNKIEVGFYEAKSHNVVSMKGCLIEHEANEDIAATVVKWMNDFKIKPYDEQSHTGTVRHIYTRIGFNTGEIMVSIIANGTSLQNSNELVKALLAVNSNICSIVLNVNTQKGNRVQGAKTKTLYGRDYIYDTIGDLKFKISHNSFFQVNPRTTKLLYQKALELAAVDKTQTVFDLYCGIGTISLFMAKDAKKVVGVEISQEAVLDAGINAKLNGIENAVFYTGAAEEVVPKLYKTGERADIVVVDPPRKGCDTVLLDTIKKMEPKKIVYISCDPATMARDLKYLGNEYEIKDVVPFDQFPFTGHVESIILMTYCGSEGEK